MKEYLIFYFNDFNSDQLIVKPEEMYSLINIVGKSMEKLDP